jgi:hypothetical protein
MEIILQVRYSIVIERKTLIFDYILGRGGGGYGFRQQNNNNKDDEIEILKDAIFIQNLPKNITRDDIQEAFSTVGPIKVSH